MTVMYIRNITVINEMKNHSSSSFDRYDHVKSRLKKLIVKYPQGIWAADLPGLYLKEYGKTLNYRDIGFSNVIELVYSLPTIFHCTQEPKSNKVLLFKAKQLSADLTNIQNQTAIFNKDRDISNTSDAVPLQQTPKVSERVPLDVMGCEESVEQISVTELNITVRGYDEILVTEIITPSFFWIQLMKYAEEIRKLMIDLCDFYTDVDEKKYKIPQAQLQVGLNVACLYDGIWHRAIIRNITLDGHINLMFYDYGTVRSYYMPELYFLSRAFSCLPAQAIPCGLYNVISCDSSKWPEKVTKEFAKIVGVAPLISSVGSVDLQNNSAMVSLTDTHGDDDVHVSDWLLRNNLAKLGQVANMPNNFPHRYYLSCMIKKDCDQLRIRENNRSAPKVQVPIVEEPGLPEQQLDLHLKVVEDRNHDKSPKNFIRENQEPGCFSCFEQNEPANVVPPELKSRLKKLIVKYPKGIWAADLPGLYLNEFGKTLNYRDIGFSNVIELVYTLRTIFSCSLEPESNRVLLFKAKQSSAYLTNVRNQASIFNYDED